MSVNWKSFRTKKSLVSNVYNFLLKHHFNVNEQDFCLIVKYQDVNLYVSCEDLGSMDLSVDVNFWNKNFFDGKLNARCHNKKDFTDKLNHCIKVINANKT